MTRIDRGLPIRAVVMQEVRRLRRAQGMSAQQLSDACGRLGLDIPRTVLANLETGRRSLLDIEELLVLAQALGVPPISLLFPVGRAETSTPIPGRSVPTWDALTWFTGESSASTADPGSPQWVLSAFRDHELALSFVQSSAKQAFRRRRVAMANADGDRWQELDTVATKHERLASEEALALRDLRIRMREQSIEPPPLPHWLGYVDDDAQIGEGTE